jgi:hypothetical protein
MYIHIYIYIYVYALTCFSIMKDTYENVIGRDQGTYICPYVSLCMYDLYVCRYIDTNICIHILEIDVFY